jgi:hypothetical protein
VQPEPATITMAAGTAPQRASLTCGHFSS